MAVACSSVKGSPVSGCVPKAGPLPIAYEHLLNSLSEIFLPVIVSVGTTSAGDSNAATGASAVSAAAALTSAGASASGFYHQTRH